VLEIDSLNRLNQNLTAENTRVKGQYEEATRQIQGLSAEKSSLSEKVAIAAQLDATGISMKLLNKKNKSIDNTDKAKTIQVNFNIARNVTAAAGARTVYVRIIKPTGEAVNGGGTFPFENRSLQYSMRKQVEYTGKETPITTYWNVKEFLSDGTYQVSIFSDGSLIGSKSFSFN
jgi:hypothetical protein